MLKEIKLTADVLSKSTWKDLESLFGNKGACGGCWCMTPRISTADYNKNKGPQNKKLFYDLVMAEEPLGVIAYHQHIPIAWCSVSPKAMLNQMKKSRIMKMTDERGVWSIVCLFIKKEWRLKGVSIFIIEKAVDFAFANGAKTVEAYPVVTKNNKMPDVFAWNGIWKSYEKAGFTIAMKVSETKLIMQRQNP